MKEKEKFYQTSWFMWLMLVLFPPIGIVLVWLFHHDFTRTKKIILTTIFAIWFPFVLSIYISSAGQSETSKDQIAAETSEPEESEVVEPDVEEPEAEEPEVVEPEVVEPEVVEPEVVAPDVEEPAVEVPVLSLGQQNALASAYDYLAYTSFSYKGLIEQLEFENYSVEDATYAVDNCGADWNDQAALAAQSYIDYTSFSKQGLIDQLIFDGFTTDQAAYGVSAVGY